MNMYSDLKDQPTPPSDHSLFKTLIIIHDTLYKNRVGGCRYGSDLSTNPQSDNLLFRISLNVPDKLYKHRVGGCRYCLDL